MSPARDDAASLTVVRQGRRNTLVSGFADGKACRTRLKIAPFSGASDGKTVIRVAPDEEFTVLALVTDASTECKVALTFVPRANASYAALVHAGVGPCRMGIVRAEGKKWVTEPSSRERRWKLPLVSNDAPQCD